MDAGFLTGRGLLVWRTLRLYLSAVSMGHSAFHSPAYIPHARSSCNATNSSEKCQAKSSHFLRWYPKKATAEWAMRTTLSWP